MRTAVDQQTISYMNQSLVLDLIKKKGRITRAGIRSTGFIFQYDTLF